jgi:hypothetical protein
MVCIMISLEQRLLETISKSKWRGEITLCREMSGDKKCINHEETEDALYHLVLGGYLEWLGDNIDNDDPLRYRITDKGKIFVLSG